MDSEQVIQDANDKKAFIDSINKGLDFVSSNKSLLTLGIKPHRPETGYGYIQTTNDL